MAAPQAASADVAAPLTGIRIVEFEGLGPGPLAGRMLADLGAEVTLVARPAKAGIAARLGGAAGDDPLRSGKRMLTLDLKQARDVDTALELIAGADALIEGNRPGVMERLGLGPSDCAARNPRLVYGRMTGWGQSGPLAQAAGHDLNYVALTGMLSLSAHRGSRPIVPPTLLGDAGGALGLCFGITAALLDAQRSGRGRVVDAAIVDIVAMLGGIALWARGNGQLDAAAPSPFHDSPFYDVYPCSDGACITLGALEPQFWRLLLEKLGLADVDPAAQYDSTQWPALKQRLADLFASRPRAHWCERLEGSDACFAPVLSIAEAAVHPHNLARAIFRVDAEGRIRAAPAPRFGEL